MGGISALGVLGTGVVTALTIAIGAGAGPERAAGGTIVGVATTKEAAPKAVRVTIDPGICGQSVPDDSIVVDASGHLSNVVVTIPGVKRMTGNDECHSSFTPQLTRLVRLLYNKTTNLNKGARPLLNGPAEAPFKVIISFGSQRHLFRNHVHGSIA